MRGKKASLDISISEMMYLRENEKLTNQEIADRVGLCKATVQRYIGKQPPELNKSLRKKVVVMPTLKPAEDTNIKSPQDIEQKEAEPCLLMETTVLRLSGEKCTYVIHADTHKIDMSVNGNESCITVSLDDIQKVIKELTAIDNKQSTIKNYKEMW